MPTAIHRRRGPWCYARLLVLAAITAAVPGQAAATGETVSKTGETLHNGIVLPATWPPRYPGVWLLPGASMPVPYLSAPPATIPIDIGRQLFVDDFLIERTDLERTWHRATYHAANPVLRPDREWESTENGRYATAMPFSDGVWYDPAEARFKAWYMVAMLKETKMCYATSRDGVHWEKPVLDVVPGTNIVFQRSIDSTTTVWLDHAETDPARRFKMFEAAHTRGWGFSVFFSADGLHWDGPHGLGKPVGDRTTAFYNPFRQVWALSAKFTISIAPVRWPGRDDAVRVRFYREHADPVALANFTGADQVPWVAADAADSRHPEHGVQPQLYNLDAVAYESVMLGLFTIWKGDPRSALYRGRNPARPKINEVALGFSRDGFHWARPCREAFIGVAEDPKAWNWGNVQSAGGGVLVVGDRLYFYVSGRGAAQKVNSTGLAVLRRDGFASLDAGSAPGELITRAVRFSGTRLFVNVDAGAGELRVAILDREEREISPFSLANCVPVQGDSTLAQVRWRGVADLGALRGRDLRFRFVLKQGSLYSFWVSPDASGASHGFVGAGGPGYPGARDTVGAAALGAAAGLVADP